MASRRATVRRLPNRASYERPDLDAVLDAGKLCHVAVVLSAGSVCIPMSYARAGGRLLLHGSSRSRIMQALAAGAPCCITVTHLDGLALAKSWFNHSMNYRSAIVDGRAAEVPPEEVVSAMRRIVALLVPGRETVARPPNPIEIKATTVVAVPIEDFSVKSRSGGPHDDPADADLDVSTGVVPLRLIEDAMQP